MVQEGQNAIHFAKLHKNAKISHRNYIFVLVNIMEQGLLCAPMCLPLFAF